MKKINFIVPAGFVGYSNVTTNVYTEGKFIFPLTVSLVDIRCQKIQDTYEDNFSLKTRDNVETTIQYTAHCAPVKENIKDFCRCFDTESFKKWLSCQVAASTAMYLSKVNVYEVEANNVEEAKEIIYDNLKKHLEKEIASKAKEAYPFVETTFRVDNVFMKLPASYM